MEMASRWRWVEVYTNNLLGIYTGNVVINFLIAFLALYNDLHVFISSGALFHALVASFIKVALDFSDIPCSISLPVVIYLVSLVLSFASRLETFTE